MQFHAICGDNIKLSHNNCYAERLGSSYDNGVVYSSRPLNIKLGEIFQLKIKKIEEKWAGSLRIGVIAHDPSKIGICRAITDMFRDSKYNRSLWVWSGNMMHFDGSETAVKLNLHSLVVNDVVGLQILPKGELHLYHHGIDIELAAIDLPVNRKFYVIFDVYGGAKRVAYEPRTPTLEDLCKKVLRKHVLDRNIDNLPLPRSLKEYLKER